MVFKLHRNKRHAVRKEKPSNEASVVSSTCYSGESFAFLGAFNFRVIHFQNLPLFYRSVTAYRLWPELLGTGVTLGVPALSLMSGVAIWYRPVRQCGLTLASLLMLMFFVAQVSVLIRGLDISCGCFGGESGGSITLLSASMPLGLAVIGAGLLVCDRRGVGSPRSDFD